MTSSGDPSDPGISDWAATPFLHLLKTVPYILIGVPVMVLWNLTKDVFKGAAKAQRTPRVVLCLPRLLLERVDECLRAFQA